jgi:hypothetical protein
VQEVVSKYVAASKESFYLFYACTVAIAMILRIMAAAGMMQVPGS